MKKNLILLAVVMLAVSATAKEFRIRVANLNCQNCANRMEAVLKQSKAVKKVQFDLPAKTVTISYKGKKDNQLAIRKMIEDAKFNIVPEGKEMPCANDPAARCGGGKGTGQDDCGGQNSNGDCHNQN